MKALVVDADAVGRRLAALLLQRLGFQSVELTETSATQTGATYDLVLTTADRDADNVASLHRVYPSARLIAVIADGDPAQRSACLQAGAEAVLHKPLALQALSDALRDNQDDFDAATWADLRQLFGADGISRLVKTLVDDLPTQQRDLEAALQGGDIQELRKIAHTLRGVSAQLGASALADLWLQAEVAATCGGVALAGQRGAELMQRHAALVKRVSNEASGH